MKLQDQCCSSEQAFKLKELGIIQKYAYFAWQNFPAGAAFHYQYPLIYAEKAHEYAAAFTVAELGIALGDGHPSWQFAHPKTGEKLFIATRIGPNDPHIDYKYKHADLIPMNTYAFVDRYKPTEAQARAELLIIFIKSEVPGFTISEINERLKNA